MIIMRHKKNKYVVAGVGLAVIMLMAGLVIWSLFGSEKEELMAVDVVRINRDIEQGGIIEADDISREVIYVTDVSKYSACVTNVVGRIAGVSITAGSLLTSDMIYTDEGVDDDLRYQKFSGIGIFQGITAGSCVDIRIKFSNGEDYIVINHKIVESIEENGGLVMKVNEEEILRMSSAQVDMGKYTGTEVYAVKYVQEYQKPAVPYYPINSEVLALAEWDPNIVEKVFGKEERHLRNRLESNVSKYLSEIRRK